MQTVSSTEPEEQFNILLVLLSESTSCTSRVTDKKRSPVTKCAEKTQPWMPGGSDGEGRTDPQ